jgi:predicted nucleic acid-binding protein
MGLKYLWDTNTIIHYLQKQFPVAGEEFIDNTVLNHQPVISVITEIELLCWRTATEDDIDVLNNFILNSIVYDLDQEIKLKTIEIRKNFRLKLPDAVIAASALVNDHVLITNNLADFNKVSKLKVIDPFRLNK